MSDAYNGKNNEENIHGAHAIIIEQVHLKEKIACGDNFGAGYQT
jgi:hypothetical protein